MSVDAVRSHFKQFELENKIMEFSVSSATVELAAQALNCEPARIAKTLALKTDSDYILIVCAGDVKIDNHAYKNFFGCKAKMLSPEEALEHTGHAVGGICPFGLKNPEIKVYLDLSLQRFQSVFPACGSANSAIELSPDNLYRYSGAVKWINVCKGYSQATNQSPSS